MADLKPFQQATVQAALHAFQNSQGSRRFLVADEVGLGKTLVAQGVIRGLMDAPRQRKQPLVVFYVCSNLTIAVQNRRRLLDILPTEEQRKQAICPVDRLTLMPTCAPPTHPALRLYTLTPDTSLPTRKGQRRDGRMQERALIHVLVKRLWPHFFEERGEDVFQFNASTYWQSAIRDQAAKGREHRLVQAFNRSVRTELGLADGKKQVVVALREKPPIEVIATLRSALAACAIEDLQPDLIIFDEFQRFLDLIVSSDGVSDPEEDPAGRVLRALRGETGSKGQRSPALLLLSATPYRLWSRRGETDAGGSHHEQFFQLVQFLYGGEKGMRRDCQKAFSEFHRTLLKGEHNPEAIKSAREQVENLLCPIMARTERTSHAMANSANETSVLKAPLHADDFKIFKHLMTSFPEEYRSDAVAYWSSIPLPLQTMGAGYLAWKPARAPHQIASSEGIPALLEEARNRFASLKPWPHPRLRVLLDELADPISLALPWTAPSLPWWPLGKKWSSTKPQKALVFSRFRAVPGTVASLISYEVESRLFRGEKFGYEDLTRRRPLAVRPDRPLLLAQFHPSPWLVRVTDPLLFVGGSVAAIRKGIKGQLRSALNDIGIKVKAQRQSRPFWQLLARIERVAGCWESSHSAWQSLARENHVETAEESQSGLAHILEQWSTASRESIPSITPGELDLLTQYAFQSPGIVFARALRRHWPQALQTGEHLTTTIRTCWQSLRNYFGQPIFVKALESDEDTFPQALQRAVLEGNLEAVLDEHLWISAQLNGTKGLELVKALGESLRIRTNNHTIHPIDGSEKKFTLRCHAAMPFAETREASYKGGQPVERTHRAEDLLKSFNSPFWPHVLVTTSLGQEGLDFHTWCRTLVHWDLCSSPVDLEQREGRIQRFAGLAIRRAIAQRLGCRVRFSGQGTSSPWKSLEVLANEELGDESGLCPWWVCEDGDIRRYVFGTPLSEQKDKRVGLKAQRLLYRLVLGHPNQEDLLEALIANNLSSQDKHAAMIQLSAFFRKKQC